MKVPSNKIGDIRSYYAQQLFKFYDEKETETLIFMLLEDYAGISKSEVFINPELTINESELLNIHFAVKDLKNYKPIQYIFGKAEFYGIPILVNPNVLIPRSETEELVNWIIQDTNKDEQCSIMDVGTGSGCIAITLKNALLNTKIHAIDNSPKALETAKKNALMNQVDISFSQIDFLEKKVWKNLGRYDIIVSNPPYVRNMEKVEMKKNVLNYEPEIALYVDDNNPLVFYRFLLEFGLDHLNSFGSLYCEINQYLGEDTVKLFESYGFTNIQLKKDFRGNDRFIKAVKS